MVSWSGEAGLPLHVLLTKADKLKRGPALNTLQKVKAFALSQNSSASISLISSLQKTGREELASQLTSLLAVVPDEGE